MRKTWNNLKRVALLGAVGATLIEPAMAQSTDEIAKLSGPDRLEKIEAAAKKEGSLALYTATPVEDVTAITDTGHGLARQLRGCAASCRH
jgi:iron(III) transport system substrate-binding protein